VIAIFVISTFAIMSPVHATFTIGDLTGSYPWHQNDFDPHVSGVIGYVWPGGGENAFNGAPNFASNLNYPGYQSPFPCTVSTGSKVSQGTTYSPSDCAPPGAPQSSWYQEQGNAYAPFGAVLAGSTGDLIFGVNSTACGVNLFSAASTCSWRHGWAGLVILLPPGFGVPDVSQVVSTITNNYGNIYVDRLGPYDRYAPGWTAVTILTDAGCTSFGSTGTGNSGGGGLNSPAPYFPTACAAPTTGEGAPAPLSSYYNHQMINFTSSREWYYVRINGVTAPWIAGRYFFKMLLYGDNDIVGQSFAGENQTQFVPTENWPVLLVKGEIDPAIVTGTVRYGGYNSTLYGAPIGEAGLVYAKMDMRLDPYTGEQRPDLPTVDAQGFFNATANGHYEVEGLAPGIYDIYAQAAGFPQQLCVSAVTVLKGQSLHFDCYVQPGPVIHGNVFTKHQFGDEPWMGELPNCATSPTSFPACSFNTYNEYIKIELYDGVTLSNIPDPSAQLVSWSPMPCVAGGQGMYFGRRHAGLCGDPRLGSEIAFPWHEYSTVNPLAYQDPPNLFTGIKNGYVNDTSQVNSIGLLTSDPQGVGPPQQWFVIGGTTTPFHFEFGVKGEYGAPRDLSGMIPQVYATWDNGLTPGRYYARAWVFRYVQTALDGSTFQEYYFDVTPQEWAGDVTLPIDLRLSSWINKTVHFHNQANSLIEDPIDTGAGFLTGYLLGADGHIYSYNQSALGYNTFGTRYQGHLIGSATNNFGYSKGGGTGSYIQTVQQASGSKGASCYGGTTLTNAVSRPYAGHPGTGYPAGFAACGVSLDSAGLNSIAINTGRANIQFWGINDTWSGENYGIPSGTYTPYTFALGYLPQGPLEQVSVTLSGTVTSISDHMIRGAGFNVTLYSIDWERPTVNRPWEFGIPVGISKGNFPNWGAFHQRVGAEIDVGIYQNGSLEGYMGDMFGYQNGQLPSTITTFSLFQSAIENNVTATGGGWDPLNSLGQVFPQDANSSYFGQELKRPGFLGGYSSGRYVFSRQVHLWLDSLWVVSPGGTPTNPFNQYLFPNIYQTIPTAFAPGQYDLRGYTYGYIQDQDFSAYAEPTQTADIRLNLVIGVNVTIDILFKKEHVITPTDMNMSGRVRLFDDQGNLVAEWMSSEGTYVGSSSSIPGILPIYHSTTGRAVAADGTANFPFGPLHALIAPSNELNYIPGGITLLHVTMAGLPQVPASGTDSPDGNNAHTGEYFGDPIIPVTTRQCSFEIDCYKNPGPTWNAPGWFPNTGISGYPDYQGGWTAEVDFVNWYSNNSATQQSGGSEGGSIPPQSSSCAPAGNCFPQFYPPVQGLLLGESYHIIPGTTATSGISLTEDMALGPWGVGHSMAANHLGPYSQEGVWQISGTHLSGEASGIFEVDLNGFISGTALAFTWANDFRPLSWATVSVTGASGATWNYYTSDGQYGMYLTPGSYSLTIASPGIASQTLSIAVTGGEVGTAGNVYMQQSNIPVPEFTNLAIVAFAALAASLYVLQRRRRK
jgi:hypothetical protein